MNNGIRVFEKKIYTTINDQEFDTYKEALAYAESHLDSKKQFGYDSRIFKAFPEKHIKDSLRYEHCIITGTLCNEYKIITDAEETDNPIRQELFKVHHPNIKILGRVLREDVAENFMSDIELMLSNTKNNYAQR
jgi:hypothetical protein